MNTQPTDFSTETRGLPGSRIPQTYELADGARVDLRITPIAKRLGDAMVRMLGYNGSVPGPTLRVRQGSELEVNVINDGDLDATVHWHGLRLDNRYDGTTRTQEPISVGGDFHVPPRVPRPRCLLVPPPHPRRLRAGDGAIRHDRRRAVGP